MAHRVHGYTFNVGYKSDLLNHVAQWLVQTTQMAHEREAFVGRPVERHQIYMFFIFGLGIGGIAECLRFEQIGASFNALQLFVMLQLEFGDVDTQIVAGFFQFLLH